MNEFEELKNLFEIGIENMILNKDYKLQFVKKNNDIEMKIIFSDVFDGKDQTINITSKNGIYDENLNEII